MSDTKNKVKQIISKVIGVNISQLSDDIGPGDLPEWDSLGHQGILSAIETNYGFVLSIDEVLDIETMEDLVRTIQQKEA
jgi:acyl carrier protein